MEERLRTGKADQELDVRGESCPVPEMMAAKRLNKMYDGQILDVITDHQPAIDVTLPYLAKRLGYKYIILKENEYVRFRIMKSSQEMQGAEYTDEIVVRAKPDTAFRVLLDPSILISFMPQVKGVRKVGDSSFILSMKWVVPVEVPIFVNAEHFGNTSMVKYEANSKIAFIKARFGFDFFVYGHRDYTGLRVREWYEGTLSSLGKRNIKVHMEKARTELPKFIEREEAESEKKV